MSDNKVRFCREKKQRLAAKYKLQANNNNNNEKAKTVILLLIQFIDFVLVSPQASGEGSGYVEPRPSVPDVEKFRWTVRFHSFMIFFSLTNLLFKISIFSERPDAA